MPFILLIISWIFGVLAALLSIFSFMPQFLKVYKNKQTKSLSLNSYLIFVSSNILWTTFGVATLINYFINPSELHNLIWSLIVIVPYTTTTFFSLYILIIKIINIKGGHENV